MRRREHNCMTLRGGLLAVIMIYIMTVLSGCGKMTGDRQGEDNDATAALDTDMSEEELYEAALKEDVLIVYTVTTRVTKTKEVFEAQYPGLCVEVRDLRSPDLIDAVRADHESGAGECDVVICNDNSGEFKNALVDNGIVLPYVPADIRDKMKEGHVGESVSFLDEAEIIFYNSGRYDEPPVTDIWDLTDEKYKGRIYIPNPLRSFSTYAFAASTFYHKNELLDTYEKHFDREFDSSLGDVAEYFWNKVSENAVFTNSSDEVMEALNTGDADIGIMVSSKLRFRDIGYSIEPVYRLDPFSGCRTSYAVMIDADSKNINSARLFVRCLLGGADGKGEGYAPFCTAGTWSARIDVPDASDVPIGDCDLMIPDQDRIITDKEYLESFWTECLKSHDAGQGDK